MVGSFLDFNDNSDFCGTCGFVSILDFGFLLGGVVFEELSTTVLIPNNLLVPFRRNRDDVSRFNILFHILQTRPS